MSAVNGREIVTAPWADGIDSKGLWTYTPGDRFTRKPIRNDALWDRIATARKKLIAKALAWREAAMADGWQSAPTYSHEDELRAFRLTRDGFVVQGLARPADDKTLGVGEISCWGPDGMSIPAGEFYDWAAIKAGIETCHYCGAHPVKTERVAFAGRACAECGPKERAKLPSNWAD